jgi:fimbrial chaperone protein
MAGAVALALIAAAAPAAASSFAVDPTLIQLSPRASSSLLAVKNESPQAVTLQVSAFAWAQSSDGEMQLQPTDDIVFFPALLTLQPGEQRRIRIGTTAALGSSLERSYRLFVEELPPERRAGDTTVVSVLTKMGIPIFLQPSTTKAQAGLRNLAASGGAFSFHLENTGSVHFVPSAVRITGVGGAGETVFDRTLQSWYVLAGGTRVFRVPTPAPDCSRLRSLAVEVHVGDSVVKERLETPRGTCGP